MCLICLFVCREQNKKTEIKYKDLNPHWNAMLEFDYIKSVETVELILFDNDGPTDEIMGGIKLNLHSCPKTVVDYPVQFHHKMKEEHRKKVQGLLKIKVEYE